ncbi:MAG: hypothetical protein IKR32_00645 [Bacteroidales bacterium]|nr:hypothetical protein [Bacteroidales bacterium]
MNRMKRIAVVLMAAVLAAGTLLASDGKLVPMVMGPNAPSGTVYDPERDGKPVTGSLGVFEHWNNPTDRQYSRNLGKGEGIELVYIRK